MSQNEIEAGRLLANPMVLLVMVHSQLGKKLPIGKMFLLLLALKHNLLLYSGLGLHTVGCKYFLQVVFEVKPE